MIGVFVPVGAYPNAYVGYIIQENGCWEWTGCRNGRGYGKIGRDKQVVYAHRFMYEQEHGPIADGMVIDHFVCENTSCVNPDHIRPVTPRENALRSDGLSARAASKTHCPYGHAYPVGEARRNRRGYRECPECPSYWGKRPRRRVAAPQPQGE